MWRFLLTLGGDGLPIPVSCDMCVPCQAQMASKWLWLFPLWWWCGTPVLSAVLGDVWGRDLLSHLLAEGSCEGCWQGCGVGVAGGELSMALRPAWPGPALCSTGLGAWAALPVKWLLYIRCTGSQHNCQTLMSPPRVLQPQRDEARTE